MKNLGSLWLIKIKISLLNSVIYSRNLKLLKKAKDKGYFLRCIYVLTSNPEINKIRVYIRESMGGHSVYEEKIKSRYFKALSLIPELVEI